MAYNAFRKGIVLSYNSYMPDTPYDPRQHVHKRLRLRLQIYFVLAVILLATTGYHLLHDDISWWPPLIALVVGAIIGVITSRLFQISWNEEDKRVVSRFDLLGSVILVGYLLFVLFRDQLLQLFVSGPVIFVVTLALFSGTMLGRTIGTGRKIVHTLRQQKLLE